MKAQQKNTHTLTPEQERTAEMLRDLYRPGAFNGNELRECSRHLHRMARSRGVTIYKQKADTYRALLAHTNGDEPAGLSSFNSNVSYAWRRMNSDAEAAVVDVTKRLRVFYEHGVRGEGVYNGDMSRVSRRLFNLADLAGIINARGLPFGKRHTLYPQIIAAGLGASLIAEELLRVLAEIEINVAEWLEKKKSKPAAEGAEPQRQPPADAPKARGEVYAVDVWQDVPSCGFVNGETIEARSADDLRPGEMASAWYPGGDAHTGRVVTISADSLTLRRDDEEQTFERTQLEFLGRVNPEPVGRHDGLTDEQHETLKKLRAKLEAVANEDDQIIRCSARYELEKKIFDITHPIIPPGDPDAWPEELRIIR